MKDRRDFEAARPSPAFNTRHFVLIRRRRSDNSQIRVGFTITKKIGNAVVRNRIRRRLKSAAAELFPKHAEQGADYIFIARRNSAQCAYDALLNDLMRALTKLSNKPK
ncbi:MAG: ribonuclease P protein component [Pseudomonadota bacterium]